MKDRLDSLYEEKNPELSSEMKKKIYGISERKKLSISKILIGVSVIVIVVIAVSIWSGVQEVDNGTSEDLQGELFQEKGIGENGNLEINESNKTSSNNSIINSSE